MAKKILVVDDENAIRDVVKIALEFQAYEVVLAEDGFEALNFYRNSTNKPELVVTDLQMPGMSGVQLINKIKKLKANQAFIAMSDEPNFNEIEWLSEEGIRLLRKPFKLQAMLAIVARAIASRQD